MLNSSSSLGGGGKIAPRSKKMQKKYEEERIPFVTDFLERNPQCAFRLWIIPSGTGDFPPLNASPSNTTRCGRASVDVHEILPRSRGGNIVPIEDDESNFLALDRDHHAWITTHPKEAKILGYSR